MDYETILLEFMAKVNDANKSEGTDAERLKQVRDAKRWAEEQYAKLSNKQPAQHPLSR